MNGDPIDRRSTFYEEPFGTEPAETTAVAGPGGRLRY